MESTRAHHKAALPEIFDLFQQLSNIRAGDDCDGGKRLLREFHPCPQVSRAHQESARNLLHYMALRRHDLRQLQTRLTSYGLLLLICSYFYVISNPATSVTSSLPASREGRLVAPNMTFRPSPSGKSYWTKTQPICSAHNPAEDRSALWSRCRARRPPTMPSSMDCSRTA